MTITEITQALEQALTAQQELEKLRKDYAEICDINERIGNEYRMLLKERDEAREQAAEAREQAEQELSDAKASMYENYNLDCTVPMDEINLMMLATRMAEDQVEYLMLKSRWVDTMILAQKLGIKDEYMAIRNALISDNTSSMSKSAMHAIVKSLRKRVRTHLDVAVSHGSETDNSN